MRVMFSEGFGSFDLKPIARASAAQGLGPVELYMGGALSGRSAERLAAAERMAPQSLKRPLARLAQRSPGPIENLSARPTWQGELAYQLANRLAGRARLRLWQDLVQDCGIGAYCRSVAARIRRGEPPDLSVVRSGYGRHVIDAARRAGGRVVVYHSIAHPYFLDGIESAEWRSSRLRRRILADLAGADFISCNSEFVRQTFIQAGFDPGRIHVHYLGPPADFRPIAGDKPSGAERRLAFVGSMDRRKGLVDLLGALQRISGESWRLDLVGRPQAFSADALAQWKGDERVVHHPALNRAEMSALLHRTGVFVFPTLAEGSARVVWEALASGCDVITTRESGSIVVDGAHGQIVEAGDVSALAKAITAALADPSGVRRRGRNNAELIRDSWSGADRLAGYLPSLLSFMETAEDHGAAPKSPRPSARPEFRGS